LFKVLTVAATTWELVDLRIRQLMPWAVIKNGSSAASETLLLDYVSLSQIATPWYSWNARHYPVLVATTSSWLIKLLIVLSTGLFFPRFESIAAENSLLTYNTKFDAAAWNRTTNLTVPAMFAFGMAPLRMTYPPGSTAEFAMPIYQVPTNVVGKLLRLYTDRSAPKLIYCC
jgi:hypothetical protein